MRELKFRAWFIDRMYGVTGINVDPKTGEIERVYLSEDGEAGWDTYAKPGEDDFHLMQFTGWHDNYGKDIYEGDLVRVVGAQSGEMVVHADDITMLPVSALYPAGEVIGNIHENPELLEG